MQEKSSLQDEYIRFLIASIEARKEIELAADQVNIYNQKNQQIKSQIFYMQQEIKELENEIRIKKRYSESTNNYSTIASSLCGDLRAIQSLEQSLSLKKLSSKDLELESSPIFYEPEEFEEIEFKMFSNFLIIGANSEKIEPNISLNPEILYSFPDKNKLPDDAINLIKSLSFPLGLYAHGLKVNESITSQIFEVFYSSHFRDGNSFIFCIKPTSHEKEYDFQDMVNYDKSLLYCCCVVFDDLSSNTFFNTHFIIPKCYCLISYFPCFELHFEILYRLLGLRRTKIVVNEDFLAEAPYMDAEKFFQGEEIGLIEFYYEYDAENSSKPTEVQIILQSVENIDYTFPMDFYFLDKSWLCPIVFSLLNLNDFYYILCALLLEKSIVFVSKNLDAISSCVLGFQSFVMPLLCQCEIIPVASLSQLTSLKYNQKLLAGYPGEFSSSLQSKLSSDVFVKLDECGNKTKLVLNANNKGLFKCINLTYNVIEKIKDYYKLFNERIVYIPDDLQIEAGRKIIEEIQKFIKWVIDEIVGLTDTSKHYDLDEILSNINENTSSCNHEFLGSVASTSAFRLYYHEL
ncbi:hypothetical protein SteCoe_20544 [Stentor coeruleus]|uniref:UDENN domain-containing protein n=1 Tax=Stentor coeruleus TaxID=5963 RepID=A0A1R2BRI6_9CILI|nr:hypothetical protein SteCoe_20544 [Stentor coeruleus]